MENKNPLQKRIVTLRFSPLTMFGAAILCTMVMTYTVLCENPLSNILPTCLFSGVYALLIPSYLIKPLKFLPVALPAVALAVRGIAFGASDTRGFVSALIIFVGFLLCAVVTTLCAIRHGTKTECLVGGTVSVLATFVLGGICAFISKYGSFSFALLREKLSVFSDTVKTAVMQSYTQAVQTEEFAKIIEGMSPRSEVTAEEFLKAADYYTDIVITGTKAVAPALVVIAALALASVAVLGYTAAFGVCYNKSIVGKGYFEYTISGFGARVFNAAVFISMLGTFIGLPSAVLVVCVNLLLILLFPLCHIGLRQVYRSLLLKKFSPLGAFLLILVIFSVITAITGGTGIIALAFAGVFHIHGEETKQRLKTINTGDNNK